jgi:plastocyanin
MTATLIVKEPNAQVTSTVSIPSGAMTQSEGQLYFDPQEITTSSGTIVVWSNNDIAAHTVTSGNPTSGASGTFDSDILAAGKTFEYKFDSPGTTEYYCLLHPWMTGKVTVQ